MTQVICNQKVIFPHSAAKQRPGLACSTPRGGNHQKYDYVRINADRRQQKVPFRREEDGMGTTGWA
jgi:hypothetical protein